MNNCIFCNVVEGEISSHKILEDENFLAFLDVNPSNSGHTLIIPKEHYETLFDVPDEILKKIFIFSKIVASKIKKNLKADGIKIINSNGSIAGQEVPHFHLHIIPKYKNEEKGKEDLEKIIKKIRGEKDE